MGNKKQANCNQPKPAYLSTLSRYSKKVLVSLLAELVVLQQCAWAYNDIIPPQNVNDNPINHIVIDPDRAGNAFIDRAQNGTPVVNINAASKGGVSANYYRDFNINSENLIWNNLQGEAGISKLGGALHGNPNFNKPDARPADIILNEITGSRVSNINGYGEVFGKKAEVIIANPNGIMVGGAGFINTSRLSLITGSSNGLDANGNLTPFTMSTSPNAIITVIGRDVVDADGNPVAYNLGIDMAGGNVMDLISRIVKINGKLLAGDEINIITGDDRITVTPDDNGDYYINGVKVGTDENGNIVTYPSAGYISATGRYDVISIGSVHWSALSDDKRGGGLGDLLREAGKAEKGSAAHDFYDEYIAIMGVDSAGKPNINNSDILATPGAIDAIRTLTNNYMSNEEFKNFENGVIRNNYFETPVKRFPLDIQARMNNSDNAVQQVLVSTFVQLGSDGDKVLREAFELFPDDDFAAMEYAINGLSSNSLKGPDRAAKELEFLNQYKK